MIDIGTIFNYYNGASFPNYTGKNTSGPLTLDGTEFKADLINNWMWGWSQNLLDMAGLTPDGTDETASKSQIVEALLLILSPPGTIVEWNLNDDPAVIGARFLPLNGQGILSSNYPDLDTNTYVGDGNNATASAWYHADDAGGVTRNTTGVYLILPESRGYTVRGLDIAANIDPDGSSRDIGHLQESALWSHWHKSRFGSGAELDSVDVTVATDLDSGRFEVAGTPPFAGNNFEITSPKSDGVNGTPIMSSESRMYNRATSFVVRY